MTAAIRDISMCQDAEKHLAQMEGKQSELTNARHVFLSTELAGRREIRFALAAVLDEQEVLVKPPRKPLARVRNLAGATVHGSGQVAPILNVADLLKSARKTGSAAARVTAGTKPAKAEAKSILVVEDSITSRMLLKGILEQDRESSVVHGMPGEAIEAGGATHVLSAGNIPAATHRPGQPQNHYL